MMGEPQAGRNMVAVLEVLEQEPGLWAGELARRIDRKANTVQQVLARMAVLGWVRGQPQGHRRVYELTGAGCAVLAQQRAQAAQERAWAQAVPPAGTGGTVPLKRNIHLTMEALSRASADAPVYGYWLVQHLERGTTAVYNMLHYLEERGWVTSEWEGPRRGRTAPARRYYRATAYGLAAWQQACQRRTARGLALWQAGG